jgi:CotH kinase protein/Lamin Tail Domain
MNRRSIDMGRSIRNAVWVMLSAAALMAGSACSGDRYGSAITRSGGAGGAAGAGGGATGVGGSGAGGAPAVPPEIDGQLVINELMAANALTMKDETGAARPWIEILNPTDMDVPLHGYGVTDDFAVPGKGVIGDGVVVPAHGYLVVWLDGNPEAGPTHVAAYLSKVGGSVGLARPDGSFIDQLDYGAQETDLSAAREPDGAPTWAIEWHVSPGAANPAGSGPSGTPAADPEAVPTAGDPSDRILGYDQMPQFSLTIGAAEFQSLLTAPDTYVPATLTYDGRDYGPVAVKTKGMESWEPIDRKPSLRVNVDKIVPAAAFFGLKDLTLNNMHSDYSMMHERIAYWVARKAGVPASRANHALVTVNGQPYGLYTNVETVKKHILSRVFGNNTGSLFSATDVDFIERYIPAYALVTGPDDRRLLSGLAAALTVGSAPDAMAAASAYVDIDQFTRFWAMCAVVGQFDSFPYSNPGDDYFTYVNPATGRLQFMPWGIDESFYSGDVNINRIQSVLAVPCMATPDCYAKFVDNVWDIMGMVEQLDWVAEHGRVVAQIAPHVAQDTRKWYPTEEVTMHQRDMWYFVSERREHITPWIPGPSGAPPTGLIPQP